MPASQNRLSRKVSRKCLAILARAGKAETMTRRWLALTIVVLFTVSLVGCATEGVYSPEKSTESGASGENAVGKAIGAIIGGATGSAAAGAAAGAVAGFTFWDGIPRFPWPPPKPSAFATIPRSLLVKGESQPKVGDVADRLENAFNQAGYGEKTWYAVPGGFALASRLEQFNPDGTPKAEPERWSAKIKTPAIFGLKDVVRALFTSQEGHYRIIVFIVTTQPFSASDKTITAKEAGEWVQKGAFSLPQAFRDVDYSPEHFCATMIYEFDQSSRDNPAVFKAPSELQGETHLRQAKIWSALGG